MIPTAALALLVVMALMGVELLVSRRHEIRLRARGAVEPAGDVYAAMRWAYPGAFAVMALEGVLAGPVSTRAAAAGLALFVASKLLKAWAIAALGSRWTFRVLVVPDAPLVTHGPYAFARHPNYMAVVGELAGMALFVGARLSGPLTILLFSLLLRRRIAVENRALRHPTCS